MQAGPTKTATAIGTAAATLTVIIALAALSVAGIPFLTSMGLAAAGTVAIAVLITLSLLPALLGFAGRTVLSLKERRTGRRDTRTPFGERWARGIIRYRVPALLGSIVIAGVLAIPALDLRLALPDDSTAAEDSTQRRAYDQLAEGFGPGFNGPLVVVVDAAGSAEPQAAATAAGTRIAALPGVAAVGPPVLNPAGDTAILQVIPASAPDTPQTTDLVHAIRALPPAGGAAR